MIVQSFLASFLASAGFGVLFNVPKKAVVAGGIAGMTGWVLFTGLADGYGLNPVLATAIASYVVAELSHVLAKIYKMPVIVFSAAGIIPLVPGGLAYQTMRLLVSSDYNAAIGLASRVFLISGAIAFGLVMAGVAAQLFLKKI
ncbi:MAG TPA: threonine/serine exporter family protein [Bacillales bacterium]|nr:threonine/serine exporter family protein [Bacillales bacterium]